MGGAIIVIDQPTGAGSGTPGVARQDLWQSQQVNLSVGIGGNTAFQWDLLDIPPGSASSLTGPTTATPHFTPDLIGTYRIQLITNGGGTGNVQILVARVRFTSVGALASRGWAPPAFGERNGESNYGGNIRGWAQELEFILADILGNAFSGGGGTSETVYAYGISGTQSSTQSSPDIRGTISFDPSVFPATGRTLVFAAVLERTSPTTSCSLQLFNLTDNVLVTTLVSTSTTPDLQESATLVVPADLPNSKKLYALRIFRTGGSSSDTVACTMARLEIRY